MELTAQFAGQQVTRNATISCSGVRYIRGGCEISSRKTPEESWQWRIKMESHCAWCNQGAVR
ncbi:hypothetical protein, partial [Stenotrophomonas maltophilia]|uniref:hypothetical protein n=1 Tax=Stenotrophomonas maltophilia TaxID=40324 RepID=UPI001EE458E8